MLSSKYDSEKFFYHHGALNHEDLPMIDSFNDIPSSYIVHSENIYPNLSHQYEQLPQIKKNSRFIEVIEEEKSSLNNMELSD